MWRAFIVAFCLTMLAVAGAEIFQVVVPLGRDLGVTSKTVAPFTERVTSVQPGSPAQTAGLRSGDLIALRDALPGDRWRFFCGWAFDGATVRLTVFRDGRALPAALTGFTPDIAAKAQADVFVGYAGAIWLLLFAALIGTLCASDPGARLLSLAISLYPAGILFTPNNFLVPWPAVSVAGCILYQVLFTAAQAIVLIYLLRFGTPVSPLRRVVTALRLAIVGVDATLGGAYTLGFWFGAFDMFAGIAQAIGFALDLCSDVLLIAAGVLALRDTRGDERSRLAWSISPLLLLFATAAIFVLAASLIPASWMRNLSRVIGNTSFFLAPLGLTYALLGRRILDIGFALNRAAVFAATSLLVAGVFAGLQWGATTLLSGLIHVRGFASQLVIVVIVYYIVRVSRQRTDQVVTRVFFAARDRRLRALRAAPAAADDVGDATALAPFVVDYLAARADIVARVFWQEGEAYVAAAGCEPGTAPIAWDSSGVGLLRSRREPVRLAEFDALGSLACPMLVRGRLRGIMFCHAPDDGELAPDERAALAAIADRVASNRDDLLAEALRADNESLRDELRRLRAGRAALDLAP